MTTSVYKNKIYTKLIEDMRVVMLRNTQMMNKSKLLFYNNKYSVMVPSNILLNGGCL